MNPANFSVPSPSAIPTGRGVRMVLRNYFLLMPEGNKVNLHTVAALPERPSQAAEK